MSKPVKAVKQHIVLTAVEKSNWMCAPVIILCVKLSSESLCFGPGKSAFMENMLVVKMSQHHKMYQP